MAEDEDRYGYLLNPIKELSKNWDVNLENILSGVDFAEASRVIQGTSSIYFKKVDYVYEDVMAFRTVLAGQKGKKGKKGANDNGEEDEGGADPADIAPNDAIVLIDYSKSKRSDITSLCLKSGPKRSLTVPLMPMSLMPLADYEKCNVPMYARKKSKEVIGKKDDFKMNTAYISEEGAILLDLLNRNLIGKFSRKLDKENVAPFSQMLGVSLNTRGSTQVVASSQPLPSIQQMGSQSYRSYGSAEADAEVEYMMGRRTSSLLPVEQLRDGSMSRACISTMDERRKTELLRPSTRFNEHMSVVNEDFEDDFGGGGFDESMGGGMDVEMENVMPPPVKKEEWEEGEDDPIEDYVVDLYNPVKWRRAPPIQTNTRMNTKKILAAREKEARTKDARKRAMETLEYLNEFIYAKNMRKQRGSEENWSKFALSRLTEQVKKAKKEVEKRKKKIVLQEKAALQRERDNEVGEEVYPMDGADDEYGGGFDDDYGIHDGMNDLPLATSSPKTKRGTAIWGDDDGMDGRMDRDGESDRMDMVDGVDDEFDARAFDQMANADMMVFGMGSLYDVEQIYWINEDDVARRREDGEEVKETMNMRIQGWSNKVLPLLEEEEGFKEFDIHHYGNTMLQVFEDVGEEKTLPLMVSGCHQREVSRYMLSILMMANTYNVKVNYDDNATQVVPMNVSLLKKDRHHEVFDQEEGFFFGMSLWVDKYRPHDLPSLTYHKEQAANLSSLVQRDDFPHLLVYGPSGAGKKTRVRCILRELYGPGVDVVRLRTMPFTTPSGKKLEIHTMESNYHIELTPSDVGIYDRVIVQDVLKEMAMTSQIDIVSQKTFKVVVLMEMDQLSRDAQHALRRTMEKYSSNCRLILCGESLARVIDPLKSRCMVIRVAAPSDKEIESVMSSVCSIEKVSLPPQVTKNIVHLAKGNTRRALLTMEAMNPHINIIKPNEDRMQYIFELTSLTQIPIIEWEKYLDETAQIIVRKQSSEALLDARNRLYEIISRCIPPQTIFVHLVKALLPHSPTSIRGEILEAAAEYEHRLTKGSKAIFHLEAFIAAFMHIFSSAKR
uniref:Rfc-3 n=1 Tax=Pristionchus pacificus TaxID=54126 RepID=A0A2A6BEF8_PRIPA|eukprot:PDM64258.1 rfc-3 [Pristionchus pacificus]